jgi:phosphatidylserine/phosphatidylglycerophosphate/cardiolipin synthase-like enzyme
MHRPARTLPLAALLVVLGVACAGPRPSPTPPVEARPPGPFPSREVVFTRPDSTRTGSHVAKLLELLAHAAPGSEVRAAVFLLDHRGLIDALARARRRGVDVRIVASSVSDGTEERLRDALDSPAGSERVFVFPGGMGRKNHNKFAVFSELDYPGERIRDVVFLSSGNFTEASLHKHQNTLVLVDANLSRAYRAYWADLVDAGVEEAHRSDYYRSAGGDDGTTRVHFFPRGSGDTVLEALEGISPAEADRPGSIHVAMARWRKERMPIADRLCELQSSGLDVQVVTRRPSWLFDSGVDVEVVHRLRRCGVQLMELPKSRVNLHSKYVLIDAAYAGDGTEGRRRVVWTGSPNFTEAALRRNDEALLRIEDPALYAKYDQNFEELVREWRSVR